MVKTKSPSSFWLKPYHYSVNKGKLLASRVEGRIAVKAGIAASLSLFLGVGLSKAMGRPDSLISGTWCVISTFVVLQANLGGTYKTAAIRMLGVLIGSLTGGLFTWFFGSSVPSLGISVILTVVLCSMFNLKESVRIACLSLSVVMILSGVRPSISPWAFSFYRILDSALGILIAVVVAHALWPTQATQKLRFHLAKIMYALSRFYGLAVSSEPEKGYRVLVRDINKLIREASFFLEESRLELLTKTASLENWTILLDLLRNVFETIQRLWMAKKGHPEKIFDKGLTEELHDLLNKTDQAFHSLALMFEGDDTIKPLYDLRHSIDKMSEELQRFRTTRKTREFSFRDVESYFVFFYNLRTVTEELFKLEDKISYLNAEGD